ncbi:MAG: hypothetical protein RLZZ188_1844 [Verrucomicrobiota bacterium]
MAAFREMHPDLVRTPGVRTGLDEKRARQAFDSAKGSPRRIAAAAHRAEPAGLSLPADHAEVVLHLPRVGCCRAGDGKGEVRLADGLSGEERGDPLVGQRIPREEHGSRGVAIKAVVQAEVRRAAIALLEESLQRG